MAEERQGKNRQAKDGHNTYKKEHRRRTEPNKMDHKNKAKERTRRKI